MLTKTKKVLSWVATWLILLSTTNASYLSEVDSRIDNMRASSNGVGIIWEILMNVFDENGQIRDVFYDFITASTDNYLPKWSSAQLVDSLIYDNGTNIGLGTTNPTHDLTIWWNDPDLLLIEDAWSSLHFKVIAGNAFINNMDDFFFFIENKSCSRDTMKCLTHKFLGAKDAIFGWDRIICVGEHESLEFLFLTKLGLWFFVPTWDADDSYTKFLETVDMFWKSSRFNSTPRGIVLWVEKENDKLRLKGVESVFDSIFVR